MSRSLLCCCVFIMLAIGSSVTFAGIFDLEETHVAPSPTEGKCLGFKETEKVLDFDVAKDGPRTAILLQDKTGGYKVAFWDLGTQESPKEWAIPKGFNAHALAWHPLGKSFFLAGKQGGEHVIVRVNQQAGEWSLKIIYRTPYEIRRLVPAPRPFVINTDYDRDEITKAYRIFFGMKNQDGTYAIRSITEDGKREYQVIGPKKGFSTFKGEDAQPSRIEALSALPLAFHPAGHLLLWEDEKRCFHHALYERDHWERSTRLSYPGFCGGTLTATPNGLTLIHWQAGVAGVALISDHGKKRELQASEFSFLSTPSSVPDGKGIVGLVKKDKGISLVYVPIRVPLADVANAWMFAENQEDEGLFSRNGGLLRDLPHDQLYSMYESEAYQCGGYDQSTPTRPYLVTVDVFWELLAAAYEGIFIVKERQQAIPAFWEFIDEAERYFRQVMPDSRWMHVFSTLGRMRKAEDKTENVATEDDAELQRIRKSGVREFSPILGSEVDYGELKPRGHYSSSKDMKAYFMAFKYLTQLAGDVLCLDDLRKIAPEVKGKARSWITAYEVFIAPSRSPVVWRDEQLPPPRYTKHPMAKPRLFPLSWGFDNEVLLSTVYHADWPEAEQVRGPSGARLVPSGLDVASALGSEFATVLLANELEKYPALRNTIEDLRRRFTASRNAVRDDTNIYDRWISALAAQWADDVASPAGREDQELWHAKRLQTGLASWATLRHATVLVNERTAAECGEAAFEPILMTPPRGYVEPDPKTFDAIAGLFEAMEKIISSGDSRLEGMIQVDDEGQREALKKGVIRRLTETAAKAKLFKGIAEKEVRGEKLSNQEYEEILTIGRIAEHHFLIFKSLASEEHALSNPDPMPKIADVAGGGPFNVPFLMAAVGKPMEWDHIVPYFGRKQMAKGAVYSYYEFASGQLMNDKDWLDSIPSHPHPSWISPFVSRSPVSCPLRNPF